jgi:L-fucose mutarotase
MLKIIDPRLNPDLLHVLALMGHGDELVVADANFPAASTASQTSYGRLLYLGNLTLAEAVDAILSLMPLDTLVDEFACRMLIDGAPNEIPQVQAEAQAAIDRSERQARPLSGLDRHSFYARAKQAYAIVQTGERRFYGTLVLRKGVIEPT